MKTTRLVAQYRCAAVVPRWVYKRRSVPHEYDDSAIVAEIGTWFNRHMPKSESDSYRTTPYRPQPTRVASAVPITTQRTRCGRMIVLAARLPTRCIPSELSSRTKTLCVSYYTEQAFPVNAPECPTHRQSFGRLAQEVRSRGESVAPQGSSLCIIWRQRRV